MATLRAFNRTYTRRLGLLGPHLDDSPFTLSEARILYELANRTDPTGAAIARALQLDPAQVSRTLKRFSGRGLVATRDDPAHGRHQLLSLTAVGRAAFAALEGNTKTAIDGLLDSLPPFSRAALLAAAETITRMFENDASPRPVLRSLRPGDLGQVIARQAMLYAEEYGWNSDYEALVARILADFHQSFDPAREDAWIADIDERIAGSIFLVAGDAPEVAKLRLLYVEPAARGAGVGKMLVTACIERARAMGYARLDLWTNSVLTAARHIYEQAGFVLVDEVPHRSFGKDLVGQTWSLNLQNRSPA
ncbi:bifunctional helix-turn-helix transcriptional regulator/GNAT family N-acetyltransferase [Sphingomonas sp. MS122]|uniref:bifunctional helix-turn-helix transcriptional regulator/GNAT family N-acetyltransferase n=1 Tax=Sphingomonas sp. MS122 TaxID=3412683 RepID=UPI003C2FC83B